MTSQDFERFGFEWDGEYWVSDTHVIYTDIRIDNTPSSAMTIMYSYINKENFIDDENTNYWHIIFRGESHEMINYLMGLKRNDKLNKILD